MSLPLPGDRSPVVYDGAVTRADLDIWESELESMLARILPLFYRTESKKHAEQYVRGLLSPIQRKNGWTIAEHVGEPEPTALQRFLNLSPWDADALLEVNREYAMEHLADPDGILVADPTGFPKKGTKSVGVQRQYSGTMGRIDNCQIATFLAYVTPDRDRVLLDRRLYLPEKSWMADPTRCAEAGVPPEVTFNTRPQQVQEMIEAASTAGVPFAWFTADEEFGQNPGLCAWLETSRIPNVMAVPKTTLFTDTEGNTVQFDTLAGRLPRNVWQRRACGIGSKGFRVYDWALVDSADPNHQYLIRCPFTVCLREMGSGCGGEPGSAGECCVDGVDGSDAVAACAGQVGADAEVGSEGVGAVPVSRDGLVPFGAAECLFGGVVRPGDREVLGE
jgi:DDE superfamily endonuclease